MVYWGTVKEKERCQKVTVLTDGQTKVNASISHLFSFLGADSDDLVLSLTDNYTCHTGKHLLEVFLKLWNALAVADNLQQVLVAHKVEPKSVTTFLLANYASFISEDGANNSIFLSNHYCIYLHIVFPLPLYFVIFPRLNLFLYRLVLQT